jgi:hypothetical protein
MDMKECLYEGQEVVDEVHMKGTKSGGTKHTSLIRTRM